MCLCSGGPTNYVVEQVNVGILTNQDLFGAEMYILMCKCHFIAEEFARRTLNMFRCIKMDEHFK